VLRFGNDLEKNLDGADAVYTGIQAAIDRHIEAKGIQAPVQAHYAPVWKPEAILPELDCEATGIGSVVWATGFRANFGLIDAPVFDARGLPVHKRGVTAAEGLYFVGLPWLHTWGSGRFSGIARDTAYLAERIAQRSLPDAARLPLAS
jgi:putative flavoprotein involved in K+ transport